MAINGPVAIKKPGSPARRNLFGPTDHSKIRKDLDRALAEMDRSTRETMRSKYGFDVDTETGVPGGRYEISRVKNTDYIPQCYRKVYTTRTRRVTPTEDISTQMDFTSQDAVPETVSTSTQAGQGLDTTISPVRRTIIGVRKLDFKENCVSGSTSTPQRVSRSSQRSSPLPSSLLQSTMTDHFQPRKRRSPDCESSLSRGKSPRM